MKTCGKDSSCFVFSTLSGPSLSFQLQVSQPAAQCTNRLHQGFAAKCNVTEVGIVFLCVGALFRPMWRNRIGLDRSSIESCKSLSQLFGTARLCRLWPVIFWEYLSGCSVLN